MFMARLILFLAIIIVAGWYIWKGSMNVDGDSNLYSADKTIEMINNLKPTAAGREGQ